MRWPTGREPEWQVQSRHAGVTLEPAAGASNSDGLTVLAKVVKAWFDELMATHRTQSLWKQTEMRAICPPSAASSGSRNQPRLRLPGFHPNGGSSPKSGLNVTGPGHSLTGSWTPPRSKLLATYTPPICASRASTSNATTRKGL